MVQSKARQDLAMVKELVVRNNESFAELPSTICEV